MQNNEVQILILTLTKNVGKFFLLLKNSSKTGRLSQYYGLSNLLFCFTKIFFLGYFY